MVSERVGGVLRLGTQAPTAIPVPAVLDVGAPERVLCNAHTWPGEEGRTRNVHDAALGPLCGLSADRGGVERVNVQVSNLR